MLLAFTWAILPVTHAQNVTPEAAAKIGDITLKFQAAYDRDVGHPHQLALDQLDTKYLGAVNRSLDAATQAANLDEALKLREEAQRVIKKEPLPPVDLDSLPSSLKQLRSTYRTALAKMQQERDVKAQPYFDQYDKLLEALQTELTKAKQIDDALAVKAKRESVALDRPKIAAAPEPEPSAPMPETAPAAPTEKKATSSSAVAIIGSPWRAVAEWALPLRAKLEIVKDGRKSTIQKLEQLPVGKFDILAISFSRFSPHDGKKINELDLSLLNPIAKTLEKLELEGCNITGSGLEAIAGAQKLKMLSLEGSPITDDALQHLAALMELQTLNLRFTSVSGIGLSHLRGLSKLTDLTLPSVKLSAEGLQSLGMLTQVEKLSAIQNRGDGSEITEQAAKLPKLREFTLSDEFRSRDACLEKLKVLTKLQRLNFNNSGISGSGVAHLKASAGTLAHISLWYGCPVTDEALKAIASTATGLNHLQVGSGGICGPEGLKALQSLKSLSRLSWASKGVMQPADYALFAALPALESLHFTDNTVITDDALRHLQPARKLKTLNLEGNKNISDAALKHIEGIKSLQTLVLRGSTVTDPGVAAFKKARPDVKVEK